MISLIGTTLFISLCFAPKKKDTSATVYFSEVGRHLSKFFNNLQKTRERPFVLLFKKATGFKKRLYLILWSSLRMTNPTEPTVKDSSK